MRKVQEEAIVTFTMFKLVSTFKLLAVVPCTQSPLTHYCTTLGDLLVHMWWCQQHQRLQ